MIAIDLWILTQQLAHASLTNRFLYIFYIYQHPDKLLYSWYIQ